MTKLPTHIGAFIVRPSEFGHEVLLTKRDQHQEKFFLPGGRIRLAETELAAVDRAVLEEVGLRLPSPQADLGKISRPGRDETGQKYLKTIRYYLFSVKETTGPVEWQKEAEKGKIFYCFWKDLEQFNDLIHFPQEKQLAAIAHRFSPQ